LLLSNRKEYSEKTGSYAQTADYLPYFQGERVVKTVYHGP